MNLDARPQGDYLLSAACHSYEQLQKAQRIGVDFVTLSPVLHTLTHPETEPLGWDAFSKLAETVHFPIFALGGQTNETINTACSYGAYGIAAIRAFWNE
jgi:thiamine-phosphate pyrophosphorylase